MYKLRQTGAEVQAAIDKIIDLGEATQSTAGLLSASDKTKLDALNVQYGATAEWNERIGFIPADGEIIIYTDYRQIEKDGAPINVPGIKVGDANAYVQDLAFVTDYLEQQLGQARVYWATYGETTYGEIMQASSQEKKVCCKYNSNIYDLVFAGSYCLFACTDNIVSPAIVRFLRVETSGSWSSTDTGALATAAVVAEKENTSNKTQTINEYSSDIQYPSAQAVYNKIIPIDNKATGAREQANNAFSLAQTANERAGQGIDSAGQAMGRANDAYAFCETLQDGLNRKPDLVNPATDGDIVLTDANGGLYDAGTPVVFEKGSVANSIQQKGTGAVASGNGAVAEGHETEASGDYSHAEGIDTLAEGTASHAEGDSTMATGEASHAAGIGTVAFRYGSFAAGKYNYPYAGTQIFSIGCGTSANNRLTAFCVNDDGRVYIKDIGDFAGTNLNNNNSLQHHLDVPLITSDEIDMMFGDGGSAIISFSTLYCDNFMGYKSGDCDEWAQEYGYEDWEGMVSNFPNAFIGSGTHTQKYVYAGTHLEYEGDTYEVWQQSEARQDYWGDTTMIALLRNDITDEDCIEGAMCNDKGARFTPFAYILSNDGTSYSKECDEQYSLVYYES